MYAVRSMRQMFALLTLPLLLASAACDISTPGQQEMAGVYTLIEMGGKPLPILFYRSEPYDTETHIVGGTLALNADSTFSAEYDVQYTKGSLGGRATPGSRYKVSQIGGTYSVQGDSIRYTFVVSSGQFAVSPKLPILGSGVIAGPYDGALQPAIFSRW